MPQHGATLLINNHFNQTGTGSGLQRITMAGHAEWCRLVAARRHREPPDVAGGGSGSGSTSGPDSGAARRGIST